MRYEPPAINFHLGETPPREPQGRGESIPGRGDRVASSPAGDALNYGQISLLLLL